MIRRLEAQDFVRFRRLDADLARGLTVVSGGSGAGKTVFLQALRFVFGIDSGGRALAEQRIRAGAEATEVAAWLELEPRLGAVAASVLGGDPPAQLELRRTLKRGGRGRCYVNGQVVSRAVLRELSRGLVSFFGQGEAALLQEGEQQRQIVDTHAGIAAAVEGYGVERAAALEVEAELADVEARLDAVSTLDPVRQAEALALRELGPELGEFEELSARAQALEERLESLVGVARLGQRLDQLDLQGSIVDLQEALSGADAAASLRLTQADEALAAAADLIGEAVSAVESEVSEQGEALAETQQELDGVERRRADYQHVARRLRVRPHELAERWASLEASSPDLLEERRRALTRSLQRAREALDRQATAISKARTRAARALAKALPEGLDGLGLAGSTVAIEVTPLEGGPGLRATHPAPQGRERVAIRVGPNGGPPGPLSQLSGGELARVYLVLGRYAAGSDRTLVFDEVDQNVGARLGAAVGQALASLAQERQVLAVTHLAPVAARADLHLGVEKQRGQSRIRALLQRSERVQELALMINGEATRAALAQARELLRGGLVSAA